MCSTESHRPREVLGGVLLELAARLAFGLALAGMGAAGCATERPGYGGPEIEHVVISSRDGRSQEATEGLANRPPRGFPVRSYARLDPLAFENDRQRVESFFREIGYFGVRVAPPVVTPAEDGRVTVRFDVAEGPRATVRQVRFEGVPPALGADDAALEARSGVVPGTPFDHPAYKEAKSKLRAWLYQSGYPYATVTGKVEVSRRTGDVLVRFVADAGPLAHFGEVRVAPGSALPERSIRARVDWAPGERFDPAKLSRTERRLYELPLIGSVRFDVGGTSSTAPDFRSPTPDVTIHVGDDTARELRLGFGVGVAPNYYAELRTQATYVQKNFFDPLNTFRATVRPALAFVKTANAIKPPFQAAGEIERDDMLWPRLRSTVGAALALDHYEIYAVYGVSAVLGFVQPLRGDWLRTALRFRVTAADVDAEHNIDPSYDFKAGIVRPWEWLGVIEHDLLIDARDDALSPTHGYFFDLRLELGRLLIDPHGTYLKITPDLRGYLPLGTERLVLAGRLKLGHALFSATGFLPLTERYFSGGADDHRGFAWRQLSPFVQSTSGQAGPIGGQHLFEGSLELRWDVVQVLGSWLGVAGFADAGDVTLTWQELDLLRPHVAVGPGLRYRTPVGPIRLDIGFRLNRRSPLDPASASPFAIQFSLGEAF